jgi:hypothetical protein
LDVVGILVIPVLMWLRQESWEFHASLGYLEFGPA